MPAARKNRSSRRAQRRKVENIHDEINSMLVAYVDGELDPITAQKVEALIATDVQAAQRSRCSVKLRRSCARVTTVTTARRRFCLVPARACLAPAPLWRAVAASIAAVVAGFGGVLWAQSTVRARRADRGAATITAFILAIRHISSK